MVELLQHGSDGWPHFDVNSSPLEHWCSGDPIIDEEVLGTAHIALALTTHTVELKNERTLMDCISSELAFELDEMNSFQKRKIDPRKMETSFLASTHGTESSQSLGNIRQTSIG